MSSIPPKTEARRRPVSVLALKLWEMAEALDERLDDPAEVLEILVSSAAKGEQAIETWERLHQAAARFNKMPDLALAYEHVAQDKRIKLLPPEQQGFIFLRAAEFFANLGDNDGAVGYAERAIVAVPGHPEACARLEQLLTASGKLARLSQLYLEASHREPDPDRRLAILRRAFEISINTEANEIAIEIGQRLLKLLPGETAVRDEVMRRLIGAGRHKDVVELLEQALASDPPPAPEEDRLVREQLIDLCSSVLKSPERALTHVEGLLRIDPSHPMALSVAESLLEDKQLMPRAAAALSDAYEAAGNVERAVSMLGFELRHVRGPRRIEVQRRLGILRQDALSDPAGALELLAPVVAGDPGDDALRQRFVELSLSLNQSAEAARLLSRALQSQRDPAVRARVGFDVGEVYLKSGDGKRALLAFQKVMETESEPGATLAAAQRLSDLYAESGDLKQLSGALEAVVRLEPEREPRQAAARRLSRLCDRDVPDERRAILAYRALVGSPWTDEALSKLEVLYTDAHDELGLSDVLAFRAERAKDPEQARALAGRALELRASQTRDPEAAIAAYYSFSKDFGTSRDVHARLIPLLEQTARFAELCQVLEDEIALAPEDEQPKLWLRLAQTRLTRLKDLEGAFEAFERALALSPGDSGIRAALEKTLALPELRLRAALLLEPLYPEDEASIGYLRVLEAKAESEPSAMDRLAAAERAFELSRGPLRDQERALDIAARALSDAVSHAPEAIAQWVSLVQGLGANSPERRARVLCSAMVGRSIDSPQLFELAQAAGDAAQAAGDLPRAIEIYRSALSFDPSSRRLIQAIDLLLAQQGAPEERLSLYEAALNEEQDPERRRDLLHAMARLQRVELLDSTGASVTLRHATREDPRDLAAHDSLVEVLGELGDFAAVSEELERVLPLLEGSRRNLSLLRLAEAEERAGRAAACLDRYRELLDSAELSDEVLSTIERLALEQNDGATLRRVLELRLSMTTDPAQRVQLLERLGAAAASQLSDPSSAAQYFLEGARLSEGILADRERARRLYDRVLAVDPSNHEAALRVVELSAAEGDWSRLADAFAIILGNDEEREVVALLLSLENRARESGAAEAYAALVDHALTRDLDKQRARQLALAKARVLGSLAGREDEAAAQFRSLIESSSEAAEQEGQAFSEFLAQAPNTPARHADLRWLFRYRAERASDSVPILMEWGRAEEQRIGDLDAARGMYEHITRYDPDQAEAWAELARVQSLQGDAQGALESLRELSERGDPDTRAAIDLRSAEILIENLGDAERALQIVRPLVAQDPSNPSVLRIVHRALAAPETRAEAAQLLEQAADAFEDPARRADVIEALLAVSAEAPELSLARSRWLSQLLETKSGSPAEALPIALRGAEAAPSEIELWRVAEQMARELEDPGPVVDAYSRAFERGLPPSLADELGQRGVEFYEEWFDEPERIVQMLERVVELCPTAGWAFDRLKLAFNGAGRWQELFALYDARLEAPLEALERIELLREAAMAARDFANDPERAIGYLEALNRVSPGDGRVEASLERLYERHGKKRPLIELLSARLEVSKGSEQADLVGRVAALWLDLAEPLPALELSAALLKDPERVAEGVHLLERLITLPAARTQALASDPESTPLLLATELLKAHYRGTRSIVDVVRMLEIEERVARSPDDRRVLLEEIVSLRLSELGDALGAFETTAELVRLDPSPQRYRPSLAELAQTVGVQARRAEVLVEAARSEISPDLSAGLYNEAAFVHRTALDDAERARKLYRRVLTIAEAPAAAQLEAARELSELLREGGDPAERVTVLERLADLVSDLEERRLALGEAAEIAFQTLADPARAISAYRKRLTDDASDLQAMNGLCVALEASQQWHDLIAALEARAGLEAAEVARSDRVRIASLYDETLGDRPTAIGAWRRVAVLHGGERDSFEALTRLLSVEERWPELADLLEGEIASETEPEVCRLLFLELGSVHENRTLDRVAALEAYVSAGDWQSAIRVAAAEPPDPELGRRVCERLSQLSVSAWQDSGLGHDSEPARAADWALSALSARLLQQGEYETVVTGLLEGATLPFTTRRRRELRREAACLVSDRLGDSERAIALFQALLNEDPADEVAVSSVTRLALLLEEKGRFAQIVELWENQASARAGSDDIPAAQTLWARAGELCEERLGDEQRALAAYDHGAELGGEACLEALARIHAAAGRTELVASALERLCRQSAPDSLGPRALALCEAYVALNKPGRARETLERTVASVADPAPLRARLATLYREARDYTALATLTEEEAGRAIDARSRLGLLREAALLHLDQRRAPGPAVPLIERAIGIEPADSSLRLLLARALYEERRFAEAAQVLRDQLARYGARRPKDRAIVHFELARALLAANDRPLALAELDAAAKIDPTHPRILEMLARTAFDQGELDRAERMYRALLLVAVKDEEGQPSRSEALYALGEIAERRGDEGRSQEFTEGAFEAAAESPTQARALESILRQRGRSDLILRVLDVRLRQSLSAPEAARVLADLADLYATTPGLLDRARTDLARRASVIEQELSRLSLVEDAVWAALGRTYAALGDSHAEARILERRIEANSGSSRPPPDGDLLYRLAATRLVDPAEREAALDLLERALALAPDFERAEAILRSVPNEELPGRAALLLERIARERGDTKALLRALERRVVAGDATITTVREGVDLAAQLGDEPLVRTFLTSALASRAFEAEPADAAWLRLELAKDLRTRGDVDQALELEEQAGILLGAFEASELLFRVAREALALDDHGRAARVLEVLRQADPENPEVFEPLLDLYRQTDQAEALVELIDATAPIVNTAEQRTQLRSEQAELLLDKLNRRADAIVLLQEVVRDAPEHRAARARLAELLAADGRDDELAELLSAELEQARENNDSAATSALSMRLSTLLERAGKVLEALDVCRSAIELDPARRELRELAVRLAKATQDPERLAEALEGLLAVERGPAAAALCRELVKLRGELADTDGVERALELGVLACPSDASLCDELARRYAERGESVRVAELLERAAAERPDDPELFSRLLEAHRAAGQQERALTLIDEFSGRNGDQPELFRARAMILIELGRDSEAISDLERAVAADPAALLDLIEALGRAIDRADDEQKTTLVLRLVEVLEATGNHQAARQHLHELAVNTAGDARVLARLASLEAHAGNTEAAIDAYARLAEIESGEQLLGTALALAELCQKAGRPELSRTALERAHAEAPYDEQVRAMLSAILEASGAFHELAELELGRAFALEPSPERVQLLLRAGDLFLSDGDVARALEALEAARGEDPDHLEVAVLTARAYTRAGRLDVALTVLNAILEANRGKRSRTLAAVYEEKANVHLEEGFLSDALGALAKAFEMDPKNARVGMRLGRLALEGEEDELAQRALRAVAIMKSAEDDGPDGARPETKADANYALAVLAQRAGDPRKAKILASKAISENPEHEAARALLLQIGR